MNKVANSGSSASASAVKRYFESYYAVLDNLPYLDIEAIIERLLLAREDGGTVYLFGNGGSAALASHFACDLGKGTRSGGNDKAFRVISLCDNVPLLTAWANDHSYEGIFSEQFRGLIGPDDVAMAISGSGNSPNVLRALEFARESGASTIGLAGFQGGKMKRLCDYCAIVPSDNMQVIEDFHLSVCHAIFKGICAVRTQTSGRAAAAGSVLQSD